MAIAPPSLPRNCGIAEDLVTIPMEVFDDLTFHNVVQVVGYVSLAFWVIETGIGRRRAC